jgi:hypothetical protein
MIPRKLTVVLSGIAVCLLSLFIYRGGEQAPDTLAEIQRLALQRGLHCRSATLDGSLGYRLIVSEQPLSFERVNGLRFGMPFDRCWEGTVAVSYPSRSWAIEFRLSEPGRAARWGRLFLFGDPAVIRKLIGQSTAAHWRPARWLPKWL